MTLDISARIASRQRLDWWPCDTAILGDDIVVSGISLRQLAEVSGTPAVYRGESVAGADVETDVVITRVTEIAAHRVGMPIVLTDVRLDNLRLVWSAAKRVDGAAPSSRRLRDRRMLVVRCPSNVPLQSCDNVLVMSLPADLRPGNLLAIPTRPLPARVS